MRSKYLSLLTVNMNDFTKNYRLERVSRKFSLVNENLLNLHCEFISSIYKIYLIKKLKNLKKRLKFTI